MQQSVLVSTVPLYIPADVKLLGCYYGHIMIKNGRKKTLVCAKGMSVTILPNPPMIFSHN